MHNLYTVMPSGGTWNRGDQRKINKMAESISVTSGGNLLRTSTQWNSKESVLRNVSDWWLVQRETTLPMSNLKLGTFRVRIWGLKHSKAGEQQKNYTKTWSLLCNKSSESGQMNYSKRKSNLRGLFHE